jgi:hypothetical protein
MFGRIDGIIKLPLAAVLGMMALAPDPCRAAQLRPETVRAFDHYVSESETRMQRSMKDEKSFLFVNVLPEPARAKAYAALRQGQVVVQRGQQRDTNEATSVPGGLIHDWSGVVFIPGASLPQTLALLQDYDRDEQYYRPDVVKSKLLEHSGDEFRVFLRLKKTYVVTAVFNSEYDVRYLMLNPTQASSRSYSTRIAEVENPDGPNEYEDPVGQDRGLLWRLYSYWRFYEADGGTYVQCQAISLTREMPLGLGWMVKPFLERIPIESLRFTLHATRQALLDNHSGMQMPSHRMPGQPGGKFAINRGN